MELAVVPWSLSVSCSWASFWKRFVHVLAQVMKWCLRRPGCQACAQQGSCQEEWRKLRSGSHQSGNQDFRFLSEFCPQSFLCALGHETRNLTVAEKQVLQGQWLWFFAKYVCYVLIICQALYCAPGTQRWTRQTSPLSWWFASCCLSSIHSCLRFTAWRLCAMLWTGLWGM